MARVVAFIPDLLFGSQVQGSLRAAGHEVELVGDGEGVRSAALEAEVLVVDLTHEPAHRIAMFESLGCALDDVRTLAFYSHVDVDTRWLAEGAGFDLIVPRSRMAREGVDLIERLAGCGSQ
ncbi:MAG TPA: hypothetical protein VGY30_09365 [Solirubrobacteraceae bacterium]|nr:hypothetical protein [Solirubrobacteraceae bacterium]